VTCDIIEKGAKSYNWLQKGGHDKMLKDRIIGAFTFRRGVYAEVEKDTTFTITAWILVIVVAFLNQLGSFASANLGSWLISAVGGTIGVVIAFALAAFVIQWVGSVLFKADVTFEEMLRTLGLAFVWLIIGVIGVLAAFVPILDFLVAPARFVALILALIAWLVATREALDLPWLQTIVSVILGFIVLVVIIFVVQAVLVGALVLAL
jgi:hypothetical protein